MPTTWWPGHDGRFARSEFALDHVEVGAAHPAGMHPHQHLAGGRLRFGQFHDAEGIGFDGGRRYEYTSLHGLIIPRGARIGWWQNGS